MAELSDTPDDYVRSELLCFLQQKSKILPFDDLVAVCVDFYAVDELKMAVSTMSRFVQQRMSTYKGGDKDRKTVNDLLKLILDPAVSLPTFVAVDLSRLPPVDATVSALLQEISMLHAEVRSVALLRSELDEVRGALQELKCLKSEPLTRSPEVIDHVPVAMSSTSNPQVITLSAAQRLQRAVDSGAMERTTQVHRKQKTVVGKASTSKLQSVRTHRDIELFVSRVSPLLAESAFDEFVSDALKSCPDSDKCVEATVKCEKLRTKHEFYASYHITVTVDSIMFHNAIAVLMSTEVWPMGMLVRRFFCKKKWLN